MIVKKRYGFFILIQEILPPLTILTLWDLFVVVLFQVFHQEWMEQPALPISLMGSALAIFVGIRNNAAYSRWWEGRSLWGSITNNCRSLSREASSFLKNQEEIERLNYMIAAYPYILRATLRKDKNCPHIHRLLPQEMRLKIQEHSNHPNALLFEIGLLLKQGSLQDHAAQNKPTATLESLMIHTTLERILSDISNAQGGLERIRNTPLPAPYCILPTIVTHLFCIMLPLSAVQTLGWITPLGSSIVGLLFQMLDRSGSDLQEPFNHTAHALPMLTMARTIERDVLETIKHTPYPAITAEKGYLP